MIELKEISKKFGLKWALKNVNWMINREELWGLIGPGASGKTIITKLIAGLLKPEKGEIYIENNRLNQMGEISLQKVRSNIGMLFQNNALFTHISVFENVAFPLRRLTKLTDKEIEIRVKENLTKVGLWDYHERFPSQLSGGQQKRVGIARAMITNPSIFIFDEPSAGLDPVTSQKIFNLLKEQHKNNHATTIMISSDIKRLFSVVEKIAFVYKGEIILTGTLDEAFASENQIIYQFVRGEIEGPL